MNCIFPADQMHYDWRNPQTEKESTKLVKLWTQANQSHWLQVLNLIYNLY